MRALAVFSGDAEAILSANPDAVRFAWSIYGLLVLAGLVALFIVAARLRHLNAKYALASADWICSRPVTWRTAGFICAFLLSAQILFVISAQGAIAFNLVSADRLDRYWLLAHGLIFHAACIVIVAFVMRRSRLSWRTVFGMRSAHIARQAGLGAICYLAALPVFVGASIIYHIALVLLGIQLSLQDAVSVFLLPQSPYALAFHLGIAVVAAPVAEELLFRGIALPLLAKSFGPVPAVVGVSLFFALVHFHIPSFLPLFVLALALSIAYIHTRNIVVPIVMHAIFNAVNIGLVFLLSSQA